MDKKSVLLCEKCETCDIWTGAELFPTTQPSCKVQKGGHNLKHLH